MKFVPYVGPAIALFEAATGKTMMGLGFDMSDEERVIGAVIGAIPLPAVFRAGAQRAALLAQISRNTAVAPDRVVGHLRRLAAMEGQSAALRDAGAALQAGRELTEREAQALAKLDQTLGRRTAAPTSTSQASGEAARGPAPTNIASRRTPADQAAVKTVA
jgi:hypothetical protein